MSGQIFISYRRDDSSAWTGRLSDRLSAHFPQSQIFMDVDMDLGINFVEEIEKNVGSCDVLIAVIGRRWLMSSDEEGRRRLDNPGDFVRLEIGTALKRGIRVIPVLVDGASVPPSGQLPEDLKPLALRNALNVSHERFRADAERLIGAVERALEDAQVELQRKREEQERLAAEQRKREEKERLQAERREAEKNARLEAERRQREEKNRLETEQRQREEKEQLEHVPQSQLPSPVAPLTPTAQPEADKPSAETPKVVNPAPPKAAESEHDKLPPTSSGGIGRESPSKQLIAFLAIAAVLVVAGLIYLATRPSKSPPPQPAPIAAVTPSPPAIATPTVEEKVPITPQVAVQQPTVIISPDGQLNLYIIERESFYGFSDKSAKPVIAPRYGAVKPFSEGLAPVYQAGSWGFIDSEGKMQIEPDFWDADNFSDGLAAVHKGGWGYIDRTGKVVIRGYLQARRFSEGVAPVKGPSGWLFIDKTGRPIDGLSGFEDATSFGGGLAAVQVGGKWQFTTHEAQKKFELEFTTVSPFSEGLAAVQEAKDGKYGFIDASGTYLIQSEFEDAKPFAEGLAAVRLNKRWGYISKSGEMRIPNRYPFFADAFMGGLALVSNPVDGSELYINRAGKPQFFKSSKPAPMERGTAGYAMCSLQLSSAPPRADVYLIPAYLWDQGVQNQPPPSKLKPLELKDYLKEHFEFLRGQTDLETRIIEQNYVAIFLRGEKMQLRSLDIRIGNNPPVSVSFEDR
jgi:hypothetical protein